MDEETLSGSDEDHDKFISIFVGSDRHLDRIVHTGLDEVDGRAATDRND